MVLVTGGTFKMGDNEGESDEKPVHQVTLKSFSIAKTETTVLQYKTFCNATGRIFPAEMTGKSDSEPIVEVSWDDAIVYTGWLAKKTGKNYRLPTQAEWEYAARGGNKSQGHKYSGGRNLDAVGWYDVNSDSSTHSVANKRPNELGIYDMSGNVWEWCKDWYGPYSNAAVINPKGSTTGLCRVLRGGGWGDTPARCRVSNCNGSLPGSRGTDCGFRVALSP